MTPTLERGTKALAFASIILSFAFPSLGLTQMADSTTRKTLIEFAEAIPQPLPDSAVQIEDLLGTPLRVASENRYWTFYESKPVTTADGYLITRVDLRMPSRSTLMEKPGSGPMLVLWLSTKVCVTPKPIQEAFEVAGPSLASMDDPGSFSISSAKPWGRFSLNIRSLLGGTKCVYGIVIDNNRDD